MSYKILTAQIQHSLNNEVNKILPNIKRNLKQGLDAVGNQIEQDAHVRTPNGTGELVRSFRKLVTDNELQVGYNTPYATYQHEGQREDGTHQIENRPAGGETGFLKNTIDAGLDEYTQLLEQYLFKGL